MNPPSSHQAGLEDSANTPPARRGFRRLLEAFRRWRAGFAALYAAATLAGLLALGCVGLAWRAEQAVQSPAGS
jgi:hypothetical protein